MTGKLIVARHAPEFHPDYEELWMNQVDQFVRRIEPFFPSDPSQAIVLTSPRERAAAVARHLHENLHFAMEEVAELSIGKYNDLPTEKVVAEMRQLELVIAISHEPKCPLLAMSVWKEFGMQMRIPPTFEDYTAAVLINPSQMPDFAWEWTYL